MSRKGWHEEHRFLYNEDGSPTEDLQKLRKDTEAPSKARFPIIRVSNRAHSSIMRVRNEALRLGTVPEEQKKEIHAAYSRLLRAHKDLAEYIERLEYAAGIPRETQIRF